MLLGLGRKARLRVPTILRQKEKSKSRRNPSTDSGRGHILYAGKTEFLEKT